MYFILTIDTEADNQWDHGRKLSVENIKFIPRFQNLCERFEIRPTYLVTYEVCEDEFARELFTEYLTYGKIEIGAHLHIWTTPPFTDKNGLRQNDNIHAFAHELDESLLVKKIKKLTDQIDTSFGSRPLSFRSGRYGFDFKVAKALAESGYLVDSSVTPYVNWSSFNGLPGRFGGPDFSNESPAPYYYNFNEHSLLEIPVTILPTRFPLNISHNLARFYFRNVEGNVLLKGLRKLFFSNQPLWLRPHPWYSCKDLNKIIVKAERLGLPFIVMMFHSSELMPGCSIYRKNEEEIEKLYELMECFFISLRKYQVDCLTLREAAKRFEG